MHFVDLNCDLGESFGAYICGRDVDMLPLISSANVACGFHAADPVVMSRTVRMAAEQGVAVGAHPGYPDLVGFGRRNMNVSPDEAKAMVQYQLGALMAFCRANGMAVQHVKPHGAMYNMAAKDSRLALAICEGIAEVDERLILLGLSGSALLQAAQQVQLPFACEVFADRAYEEDGSLVARGKPGAMIENEDEAVRRVLDMVQRGCVKAITGREIPVQADSICLHGDQASAVAFARRIRTALEAEQVQIVPLEKIIKQRMGAAL